MARVGVITQARMTSTRLPGKVLLPAGGRTMLDRHVQRLRDAGLPVIIATSVNAADDPIVAFAVTNDVPVVRGSESDVLSRYHAAILEHDLDVVVRVTSDCPLIDGELIATAVRDYMAEDRPETFLSNTLERTYPRGFDFEVFSRTALIEAHERATHAYEREHVTPYLYAGDASRFKTRSVVRSQDASGYRVTLDTPEDLAVIKTLIEEHDADALDVEGIIAILDSHPDLVQINAAVEQKKLGE